MQRNGVTFEEVITAANHIQSQGQNPTIEKIRLHLGSGSNTTITKYLKAWRDQQQILGENKPTSDWSADIVKMAAEQAWISIRKEAEEKIARIKEETNQAVQEAEQQLKIAKENEGRALVELAALCEQLNEEMGAKELQSLDFKKLQHENALLMERYMGLEKRLADREEMYERNLADITYAHAKETKVLEEKCAMLQKNHEALIDELKTQFENARHQSMLALDQAREENKKLSKNILNLNEKIQQKEVELAETKALLNSHVRERDESLNFIANLPSKVEDLKTLIAEQELDNKWRDINKQMIEMRQASAEATAMLLKELKAIKKVST